MFCWLQCEENVHFAGFVLDGTECLDEMAVFQILQNLVQNRLCKFRSVSQIPCPDSYDPSLRHFLLPFCRLPELPVCSMDW